MYCFSLRKNICDLWLKHIKIIFCDSDDFVSISETIDYSTALKFEWCHVTLWNQWLKWQSKSIFPVGTESEISVVKLFMYYTPPKSGSIDFSKLYISMVTSLILWHSRTQYFIDHMFFSYPFFWRCAIFTFNEIMILGSSDIVVYTHQMAITASSPALYTDDKFEKIQIHFGWVNLKSVL